MASHHGLSDDVSLVRARYGVGVSWDATNGRNIDIDLQCVVVNNAGTITDCAYYNNLKAARAVTHSGDEAVGKPDKIEEMVWVNMRKLPTDVSLLIFVVAAYSGGQLKDVCNGRLHLFEEKESNEVALVEMERSAASVDVVAAMFLEPGTGTWKFHTIDQPAQRGQHFMDILPLLSQVIRGFLPTAPAKQKVAFAMEKGGILDLPMDMGQIVVGLGWDVDDGECDLDVSAVLMDTSGQDLETVFFGRLESEAHGVRHTGDNLTGEGDGDDEQIVVNLDRVGPNVSQICFVVNIYTPNHTFAQVANPFCRVVDTCSGAELCRYSLREAGRENGLIVARLAREAGGRWGFHALGVPCRGRTYKDSLPQIRACTSINTSSLVVRSHSLATSEVSVSAWPPSDPPAEITLPSPWEGNDAGKCCICQ